MINIKDPAQLDALMVRVQARRVAQAYQGAGRRLPPLAARVLEHDSEAQMEEDDAAYRAWCAARGVECIRVLGVSDFAEVAT